MKKTLLWAVGALFYGWLFADSLVDFVRSFSYETPYIAENVIDPSRIPTVTGGIAIFFLLCANFCFMKTLKSYCEV